MSVASIGPTPNPAKMAPHSPVPAPTSRTGPCPPAPTNARVDDPNEYNFSQLLPYDGIRPVYEPKFATAADAPLLDDELVMGIAIQGEAKAYPVTVLRFREMVNDELDELEEATNTIEQADALVDAIYYICDTAVRHGMNLDPLFSIVHRANMQKVVDGKVIRREDGKILKPEGWEDPEPYLRREMENQEKNGSW